MLPLSNTKRMDLHVLASLCIASAAALAAAFLAMFIWHPRQQLAFNAYFATLFTCCLGLVIAAGLFLLATHFEISVLTLQLVSAACISAVWMSVMLNELCSMYDRYVLTLAAKQIRRRGLSWETLTTCTTHVFIGIIAGAVALTGHGVMLFE